METIEFVQYFTGRSSDIDDIMLNTLGGVSGYLVFALFFKLFGNKEFFKNKLGI
ncbi:MAG: VanZ family protein [Lachnospiraceae bacterium]|nr:VanZ family protein [Lachnospiraceae bacterium]